MELDESARVMGPMLAGVIAADLETNSQRQVMDGESLEKRKASECVIIHSITEWHFLSQVVLYWSGLARLCHCDDDAPRLLSGFDIAVSFSSLIQRITSVDDRFDRSGLNQLSDVNEVLLLFK